jgi:sugar/nucleoside kinase (ribokinase family)
MGTVALDDLKTPSGIRINLLGGSASHLAMSASLFTKVHLASIVGSDFPKRYIGLLQSKNVDLSSLVLSEGKTFHWNGEYKKDAMSQAITNSTELGVLVNYEPRISESQRNIPFVFLANFTPDIQMKFLTLMKRPKLIGLDSMNLWINTALPSLKKLMKKVDLFVANEGEATALTGETNLIKASKALRQMGPSIVVVKKGEHGVIVNSDKFMFGFVAYPVAKVVDPTGAGDTFAGGLMGYLTHAGRINEKNMRQACIYATICSSFNVEGFAMEKTAKLKMTDVNARRREFLKFGGMARG